ncbi:cell envelope-related function transcriptional attenuator common domain protein [Acididesulfobacillus acetoxydans]|uniref:Cell envelope-related function transcriptional attenuator common domain protein n=1 Tax=Acididesulfobacillus acetoxydans TaxID=1561005 RepID=A0A8S0W8T5_9FIRM|nr:LCP family protein [Acididesulfobacillus acetoxydans]CAA7602069.1 cell envelope-related function transcriptional attenuator common domain protein [Acididesulfobacillus acetoxydans]CEJ08088.1 Transcriptional attenuator, LytR [Acididesulfobacillus acetoxydans]
MAGTRRFSRRGRRYLLVFLLAFTFASTLAVGWVAAGQSLRAPAVRSDRGVVTESWLNRLGLSVKQLVLGGFSAPQSGEGPGTGGIGVRSGTGEAQAEGAKPSAGPGTSGAAEARGGAQAPGEAPAFRDGAQPGAAGHPAAKPFSVLLVGVDNRPGEHYISNTDTLILAHLDPAAHRLCLLSVPRDTQIDLPGHGTEKINAVARLDQGLGATVRTVGKLLNEPVQGYVEVNFAGFKRIIDILGGVTLTVDENMYYVTGDKKDGVINLKKGTQHLNGSQALQYVRFRYDRLADIARTMRQQTLLKAVAKEVWQVKTLPKLPWLIPEVYRAVHTDLPLSTLLTWGGALSRYSDLEVVSQTLPGSFAMENGISYWRVDRAQSRRVVQELFERGQKSPVFVPTPKTAAKPAAADQPNPADEASLPVSSTEVLGEKSDTASGSSLP